MKTILLAFLCLWTCREIYAQKNNKLDSLENERLKNYKKIEELNQTIMTTGRTKAGTLTEYQTRKTILERYLKEIKLVQQQQFWFQEQIAETQQLIEALENDEKRMRTEYQKTIYELSKLENQARTSAANLLSIDSWNEINQKKSTLTQFERNRREQLNAINATVKKLSERKKQLANLEERRQATEKSLKSDIAYEEQLRKDLETRLRDLQKREKDFLTRKQSLEKFNDVITKEINDAAYLRTNGWNNSKGNDIPSAPQPDMATARDHQKTTGKTTDARVTRTETSAKSTPAGSIRTNVFAENKSLLPWPVDKFNFIAARFGIQDYPGISNIQVENLGIDISTMRNEPVRNVFDGTVIGIRQETDMGWIVIVQHDDYLCVYARLQNVAVKKGSRVKARAVLGTVGLNQDGYPMLQFQIWKHQQNLNPEDWLAKNVGN